MMTYRDLYNLPATTINDVIESKVDDLYESMKKNGYVGCPILIYNGNLLTGSHRLCALDKLYRDGYDEVFDWEVAEDVTDIVKEHILAREESDGWAPDIDYSNIGWLLEGSWVEQYKDEIAEW